MGNIAEHPYEIHHIPPARHDDPDVVVSGHWILAAAIIGSSMAFIDGTVANVALPSIQSDLGATLAEAQWVVQAYALLLATLVLVGGSLGDHFGHRRVFVLGISIFTLGSVGCAVAASPGELIAARGVQALGAAGMIPGSLATPSNLWCGDEEARQVVEQLNRDAGYEPVYGGPLENAALQENFLKLEFAINRGGLGRFFYRMAPPDQL